MIKTMKINPPFSKAQRYGSSDSSEFVEIYIIGPHWLVCDFTYLSRLTFVLRRIPLSA